MKILITGNLASVGPGVTRQLRSRFPDATLVGIDMGCFAHGRLCDRLRLEQDSVFNQSRNSAQMLGV